MANLTPEITREITHGRQLQGLRWKAGVLQQCFSEKFEQYEHNRLITGGTRLIWEDVPSDCPEGFTLVPGCTIQAGDLIRYRDEDEWRGPIGEGHSFIGLNPAHLASKPEICRPTNTSTQVGP